MARSRSFGSSPSPLARAAITASLALLPFTLAPNVAQAQWFERWELGAFGQFTKFSDTLNIDAGIGGGARLGVAIVPGWNLEADWSMSRGKISGTSAYETVDPAHVFLFYAPAFGTNDAFLLGGGVVRNDYRGTVSGTYEYGAAGDIGFRLGFGENWAGRLDGVVDYIPHAALYGGSKNSNSPSLLNISARAGLSVLFGHTGPRDADKDGVYDAADACPDTPAGTAVDSKGCPMPLDHDHDGVIDDRDACPNTPAGDTVDDRGCSLPKDADRDGVINENDACPNTPVGDRVDARGCTIPKDADNDGVPDDRDRCLNTPAGDQVDANGCSLPKDDDKDGVINSIDRCPNTPAGTQVDDFGCPKLFAPNTTKLVLQGVNFETGKATLTPESSAILDNVAAALIGNPDVRVEIAGYTDSRGTRLANTRLSQARANAVKFYLISKGVDGTRLVSKGYGPANPIAPNTTAAGRAQNRRVELHKIP